MRIVTLPVVVALVIGHALSQAAEPRLVNAKMETRSAAGGLKEAFAGAASAQAGPAWIGYAVPIVEGRHRVCCSSGSDEHLPAALRHGRCRLEGSGDNMNYQTNSKDDGSESPSEIMALYRVDAKRVGKIRVFTSDCELDAGGLPVVWLTEVGARDSVAFLASFAEPAEESPTSRKLSEAAVNAIAFHAGDEADAALARFAGPSRPEKLRKDTAFWLGELRGQKGYEVLRGMVRTDPADKIREQCVFALSVSRVPEAVGAMIASAREDKSPHVRGQALFWLSQKAGEKAAKAIADSVENDPETEVKKKAVFALSQLPRDEGVPQLIKVARANRNKVVRKEAMFWLGESRDDRALAFFEEVLTKN
jgi:hypothetical protein